MGQNSILNKKQKLILDEFRQDDRLSSSFYFSGGTALSEFYLKHRESLDLDFFNQNIFNPQTILEIIESWSRKYNFSIRSQFIDPTYNYFFHFDDGQILKVDFTKYPYKGLEEKKVIDNLKIDSLFDIAVNKLLMINQRSEVKDFVDLYFVLDKFNFWQLKDGVAAKFNIEIDPFLAAVDFTKIEDFEILPKMYKKLELSSLKTFYMDLSKALGLKSVNN